MTQSAENRRREPGEFVLLVSGFEPFGQETINPASLLLEALPAVTGGVRIEKVLLPVSFRSAFAHLKDAIDRVNPDGVLCLGQAGGRAGLTFEKIGINLMEASMADNDGVTPHEEPIVSGAADGLFSTVPVSAMVQACKEAGVPASVSYTAGTYVCNCLLYSLLQYAGLHRLQLLGGFVHVPWLPVQAVNKPAGTPSMSLQTMLQGLGAAISVLSAHKTEEASA